MRLVNKLNYILNKRQKIQLLGILLMILVGSVLELLGVSAILPLINVVMQPQQVMDNKYYAMAARMFNVKTADDFVFLFAGSLCFIYIIKNIFLVFSRSIQLKFAYATQKKIALRLMDCYLNEDYLFHVAHNISELQRNVKNDSGQFFTSISTVLNLLVEAFTCILLVVFLFFTDPGTTVLATGILAVVILIFWIVYRKIQVAYGKQSREASAKMNKWLIQSFSGIKEIKVMNREKFFLEQYDSAFQDNIQASKNYNIAAMLPKHIIEPLCICSLLLTMCIQIKYGKNANEFISTLAVFAAAAIRMLPAFNRLTEYMSTILYNKASVDNVFEDLKEAEALKDRKKLQKRDVKKLQLDKEIRISNLTFAYPQAEQPIFSDASLIIKKNKSVAFVGSSGSGKTTLADIIIGLLTPLKGEVFVDDKDVFLHLDAWHKSIGYIPQTIYLMDDTIRANVVFGIPEEEIDDEMVWKALERAELAEFVRGLEKGIYTGVGDRGMMLSGGQRQRIGIARALYKEPDVLILDEATSALDNETEAAVMQSIENLQGKTTLIIIAHRLSTIQNCDEIYSVENGKIVLQKESQES
ncbi:MAG: ABC transporter ATP-binding protein [Lachnospiraceae bacterium]